MEEEYSPAELIEERLRRVDEMNGMCVLPKGHHRSPIHANGYARGDSVLAQPRPAIAELWSSVIPLRSV